MAASQLLHTPGSEHLSPLTRAPQHLSVAASQIRIILELANTVPLTCRTRTKYWSLLQHYLLDPACQSPILCDTRSSLDTLRQVRSAGKCPLPRLAASERCTGCLAVAHSNIRLCRLTSDSLRSLHQALYAAQGWKRWRLTVDTASLTSRAQMKYKLLGGCKLLHNLLRSAG